MSLLRHFTGSRCLTRWSRVSSCYDVVDISILFLSYESCITLINGRKEQPKLYEICCLSHGLLLQDTVYVRLLLMRTATIVNNSYVAADLIVAEIDTSV